jgi:hypothetical protein
MNSQHDMRARLFRERNPEAFAILTDPNPPALKKLPIDITPEESARIAGKVLTQGEEDFRKASHLKGAGSHRRLQSDAKRISRQLDRSRLRRTHFQN